MDPQNYTEIIPANKSAEIRTAEGYVVDFYIIALSPSQTYDNEVKVFIRKSETEKVLLCILSERLGIYQVKTELEVNELGVVIDVIGKGTVTMTGISYIPDVGGCCCGDEDCCCDEDGDVSGLIDDEDAMDEE